MLQSSAIYLLLKALSQKVAKRELEVSALSHELMHFINMLRRHPHRFFRPR